MNLKMQYYFGFNIEKVQLCKLVIVDGNSVVEQSTHYPQFAGSNREEKSLQQNVVELQNRLCKWSFAQKTEKTRQRKKRTKTRKNAQKRINHLLLIRRC
jgi:hypothetical protein